MMMNVHENVPDPGAARPDSAIGLNPATDEMLMTVAWPSDKISESFPVPAYPTHFRSLRPFPEAAEDCKGGVSWETHGAFSYVRYSQIKLGFDVQIGRAHV